MSEELCQKKTSHKVFLGKPIDLLQTKETRIAPLIIDKPIDPCFFCCHGSMGFPKHLMEVFSLHNSSLISRKNQAKFKRWLHRIKITQPHLKILVSFSSAEYALSNDVYKTI